MTLFRTAFVRTAYFVAMVVPLGNALSAPPGSRLTQNFRGTTLVQSGHSICVVTSVAVVAILWRWLLSAEWGIINHYLGEIMSLAHQAAPDMVTGQSVNIPWLNNPHTAMPAIAMMSIWWGAGGNMLVYLAGLKQVPRELMEAAEIDGATPLQRFWKVTWPLLRPTTLFCLVMSVIGASQVFRADVHPHQAAGRTTTHSHGGALHVSAGFRAVPSGYAARWRTSCSPPCLCLRFCSSGLIG